MIERISNENPNVLLENDAFSSILLFVDFFDINIKKYVTQSCYNMTKFVKNNTNYKKFIEPGLPSLTSLTKLSGSSDLEKNILNQAILCFYNILTCFKNYKLFT